MNKSSKHTVVDFEKVYAQETDYFLRLETKAGCDKRTLAQLRAYLGQEDAKQAMIRLAKRGGPLFSLFHIALEVHQWQQPFHRMPKVDNLVAELTSIANGWGRTLRDLRACITRIERLWDTGVLYLDPNTGPVLPDWCARANALVHELPAELPAHLEARGFRIPRRTGRSGQVKLTKQAVRQRVDRMFAVGTGAKRPPRELREDFVSTLFPEKRAL